MKDNEEDILSSISDLEAKSILDKLAKDIGYDRVVLVRDAALMQWDAHLARDFGRSEILCGSLFYDSFKHAAREYVFTDKPEGSYKDLLRKMLDKSAEGCDVSIDVISKFMRRVLLKKNSKLEEILIKTDMHV